MYGFMFESRPYEEGIKTLIDYQKYGVRHVFESRPYEEGIKTNQSFGSSVNHSV